MSLSNETRDRVKRSFEPLALALGRLGLSPDALTLIGFVLTAAGAVLLAVGAWLPGGVVVFVGGVFDLFDGTLARATGRVTRLGGFMDSVFDRWGEVLVYAAIVIGTSGSAWVFTLPGSIGSAVRVLPSLAALAMGSSVMVSYVRAKSEGLGFTTRTGMAEIGLMPREVRLVVLSLGLVLAGAFGGVCDNDCQMFPGDASGWLAAALAIIAALATVTVVQRILVVRRQAAIPTAAPEATVTSARRRS